MYRAFKIEVNDNLVAMLKKKSNFDHQLNKLVDENTKDFMKKKLQNMILNSSLTADALNAGSIWDEWFPKVKADVFISHSSKDASLAKSFASWLKRNHQLTAFIDSEIWGHSDELLKELDDKYCYNQGGETYNYKKRNGSTAHVHMMLSYALTRMIDRTECFIFLESHNSATAKESVNGTYSPWIFHELATVDTIEPKQPMRLMQKSESQRSVVIGKYSNLIIKYPMIGKRLREIDSSDLSSWTTKAQRSKMHSLDILYQSVLNQEGGM